MTDLDTTTIDLTPAAPDDAALVERILDGDREAIAEVYDRYADRIHTMSRHMLGNDEDAADVTGEVFLTAVQRLQQLREPAKLRLWLYAICRHEVYARTRQRARVHTVDDVEDLQAFAAGPDAFETAGPDATAELPGAEPARLAELLQTAAGGLDERDRMVLELSLAQGLDGSDLADALGVRVANAYQMTHRMRERLERSLSALLVVSAGRDQCADLEGVAKQWDGTFDVLWRKRFARHVDGCRRCQMMRSRLPKAALSGVALAQAAQAAVLAAPISVRRRVLEAAPGVIASGAGRAWSCDRFPRHGRRRPRRWQLGVAALLAVMVGLGVRGALGEGLRIEEGPVTAEPGVAGTTVPVTGGRAPGAQEQGTDTGLPDAADSVVGDPPPDAGGGEAPAPPDPSAAGTAGDGHPSTTLTQGAVDPAPTPPGGAAERPGPSTVEGAPTQEGAEGGGDGPDTTSSTIRTSEPKNPSQSGSGSQGNGTYVPPQIRVRGPVYVPPSISLPGTSIPRIFRG